MPIRVKAVLPFPTGHNTAGRMARNTGGKVTMDQAREAWLVLGSPLAPDHNWVCGTDVVWPVLQVEGIPGWQLIDTAHVCRHQIIAGD